MGKKLKYSPFVCKKCGKVTKTKDMRARREGLCGRCKNPHSGTMSNLCSACGGKKESSHWRYCAKCRGK